VPIANLNILKPFYFHKFSNQNLRIYRSD